ncbi:AAA domain-containing protein [Caldisericum sp. AR60]|uniref:AAA domain-containing protein n=1 Tax=Caldisericum sp. AR60 TaxID=3397852 RepID=UPI0039FD0738
MVNLKGVVIREFESAGKKCITLSTDSGVFNIVFEKPAQLWGVKKLSFVNLKEERGALRKTFLFTDDSFVSFYPGFLVQPEEIEEDSLSTLSKIFNGASLKESFEGEIFYAVRGIKESNRFKTLVERFPKDIKAKFSFYPYIFDTTFGFFVKDALFFGRFPVVFEDNFTKGIVQAISSKFEEYLVMSSVGTFEEKKISLLDKKQVFLKRNEFANLVYSFFKVIGNNYDKPNSNMLDYAYLFDHRDVFEAPINDFLKEFRSVRKHIKKLLESRLEDIETTRIYNAESDDFTFKAYIKDNELNLDRGTPCMLFERPPLNMRIFGIVKSIDFNTISGAVDYKTVSPEFITPLKTVKQEVRGIINITKATDTLKDFLINGKFLPHIDKLFDNPVDLIADQPVFAVIKGSFGTGKKHIIGEFLQKYPGAKIIIFSKGFYKSLKEVFGNLVEKSVENLEGVYDYIFYFDRHIDKNTILNLASFTKNIIVFTYDETVPYENLLEESRVFRLKKVFGFDKFIHKFVLRFYALNSEATSDVSEIKILNKENIESEFIPLVNPEKVVQFVQVKGAVEFERNKLNKNEANFTTTLIVQFLKGGVDRSSIEVIVPYERQKAYIIDQLKTNQVEGVRVSLVEEAIQSSIVVINFVDVESLPNVFEDKFNLAFAITRARSKVIFVGSPALPKKEKLLS